MRFYALVALFFFIGFSKLSAQSVILDRFDIFRSNAVVERDSLYLGFQSAIRYAPMKQENYFKILPFYSYSSSNSEYADGFNDGAHWQGRGLNQAFSFGLQGRKGRFEYTFAPILSYAENQNYDYGTERSSFGRPTYQNQYTRGIDYVMRYGNEALTQFNPGQTEIAYKLPKLRLSFGTANQWWGGGIYQSALMSNNAPGFWHLRVENHKPFQTRIGDLGFQFISGILQESSFFNENSNDNQRIYNGLVLSYKPSFFKGLTLSLNRVMMLQQQDSENVLDYTMILTDFFRTSQLNADGSITERNDQLVGVGLDWRSSSDHFRVYMEWIRGDFESDIISFLEQPEHNAGFTWGLVKQFLFKHRKEQFIQLSFEQANLAVYETARLRSSGSLYGHTNVTQGLTNNGQLLAAAIGPGSSFHGLNVMWHRSIEEQFSFEYLRTRFNDDYHFLIKNSNFFDIQHHLALTWQRQVNDKFSFSLNSGVGIRDNPFNRDDEYAFNIRNQLVIRYTFSD